MPYLISVRAMPSYSQSNEVFQLNKCQSSLFQNTVQSTFLEFSVKRYNDRNVPLEVMKKDVTPSLVVNDKSSSAESLDHLPA